MTEPKKAEVTLATKHVHGGREYDRGDVLTLREDQAAWLIAKQIAVKKGDALPALPSEIQTVKDMREVEAAVAQDLRVKAAAKAAKA